MGEIITGNGKKGNRNIHNSKVDLTPMVDLGFLLITFFIFTTTLYTNTVMNLVMPKASTDSLEVAASGAISLIASKDAIVFIQGHEKKSIKTYAWKDIGSLRQQLIASKQALIKTNGNDNKLFVMIKPKDNSNFGQVISLFDEMTICGIKRYSLTGLSEQDAALAKVSY
jgi:biopolymer transport protein ExbD